MNSATISVTRPHPAHALDRLTMALLLGFVAALQLSIALAQILLAAVLVSWVASGSRIARALRRHRSSCRCSATR